MSARARADRSSRALSAWQGAGLLDAASRPPSALEAEIDRIARMSLAELRAAWTEHMGDDPPGQSKEILRRRLAWELQARVHGGLSAETKRKLKQLHERFTRDPDFTPSRIVDLKPGTVLVREWKGVRYQIHVLPDGFAYAGQRFESLSEIARAITGQRWSGPLFFGLRQTDPGKGRR